MKKEKSINLEPKVNIVLINYDASKQNEYSKKFMAPLIEGLLQRIPPVYHESNPSN